MIVKLASGGLEGVDAFVVDVEVDFTSQGLPAFNLVGLAETEVRESRDRVFAALRACAFRLPPGRITVNLAPASKRKNGTGYDLPLALALLAASGQISQEALAGYFFAGELSLAGELKPVRGVLPLAILAAKNSAKGLLIPPGNAAEAAIVEGLNVFAPATLEDAVWFILEQKQLEPCQPTKFTKNKAHNLDYAEVKGQFAAKRALEIAAAGGHNLLMIGPPGSGKTMLAQRLPSILPPLSFDEALEVTKIYSVAGYLPPDGGLVDERPFRSPHHTLSGVALVGGGTYPRPGEISLAHRGVLFLDELPEYEKSALEALRQPLEDGSITISRAAQSVVFPAACMLVAAMNPCPCGYYGDRTHKCVCRPEQRARYRARLSGPLLDRIDLHIEVPAVPYSDLSSIASGPSSAEIRTRVLESRTRQMERYRGLAVHCNAELAGSLLETYCVLDNACQSIMETAISHLGLSARSYTRVLRLARTIADLDGKDNITSEHLAEAISLRVLDRANQ